MVGIKMLETRKKRRLYSKSSREEVLKIIPTKQDSLCMITRRILPFNLPGGGFAVQCSPGATTFPGRLPEEEYPSSHTHW